MSTSSGNSPRNAKRSADGATATARGAEFRPDHGALSLWLGGRPVIPCAVDVEPETPPTVITQCASAGVPLLRVQGIDLCWAGGGKYDYRDLDARLDTILKAAPRAMLMLMVTVDAPVWWCEAHPEECAVFAAPPEGDRGERVPPAVASWASTRWRNEVGDALVRLVRHVRQPAYGERCIAFQLVAGEAGEWRHPGAKALPDVGARMTERFRAYAVERYRRNEGLLKQGWDDPRAAYSRIRCPGVEERRAGDYGLLRNPVRSRHLLDYIECYYGEQTASILHFAARVKRASEGQALVGLAYGTLFDQATAGEGGHAFPEAVLDSADVDFCANTAPVWGAYLRALTGSLALRSKFLFHVAGHQDPLTALALAQTQQAGLIVPATVQPETLAGIVKILTQRRQATATSRKRTAQVAVIVDPACANYVQSGERSEWLLDAVTTAQMRELATLGTPYDVYMPADLFHPDFPNYKVYLCPNLFYLSEAERRKLDARLKRSEQSVVWIWGAGLASEAGIDGGNASRTTGIKLRVEMSETELRARIVEAQDPLTWGFHPGAWIGAPRPLMPTITVTDKATVRLGANTDNKTVFAVSRQEQWTSVLVGVAPVPSKLLRNVLRAAGCHLYADVTGPDDFVTADAGLAAVRSATGRVTLSLPGLTRVQDAITGADLGTASDFELILAPNRVGLYFLHPLPKKRRTEPEE